MKLLGKVTRLCTWTGPGWWELRPPRGRRTARIQNVPSAGCPRYIVAPPANTHHIRIHVYMQTHTIHFSVSLPLVLFFLGMFVTTVVMGVILSLELINHYCRMANMIQDTRHKIQDTNNHIINHFWECILYDAWSPLILINQSVHFRLNIVGWQKT